MALFLYNWYRTYMKTCKTEFYEHIQGLLDHETVKLLDNFTQHFKYTRLRHSLDVAYYSFFISRLFCLDSRSAARAGLLHDLFFHEEGQHSGSLLISHPRIALENARQICSLNKVEENIILRHMWLLTPCPPKYVEGFVVTFVDKYCAAKEFIVSTFMKKHRMRTAFSVGV